MAFTVHIAHQIGFTKIIMKTLLTENEGCTHALGGDGGENSNSEGKRNLPKAAYARAFMP